MFMSKENGLIRSMDKLGRIVIPAEARKQYGWDSNDPIEMIFTTEGILLAKPEKDDVKDWFEQLSSQPEKAKQLYALLSTLDFLKK